MTHRFFAFTFSLFTLLLVTAGCKDDEVEGENTKDCMVQSAVIGTLNRTVYTKGSQGQDSTYTITVQGYYYPLSIDQINNRIYNSDSLPYGTDVASATFSSFAATGSLGIKEIGSDWYNTYSYNQATNFSTPRHIRVYTPDGSRFRTYEVKLNVHKQQANDWNWQNIAQVDAFASLSEIRSMVKDDCIYVWGSNDGRSTLVKAATSSPEAWETFTLSQDIDTRYVQFMDELFYTLADGKLIKSTDGIDWLEADCNEQFDALITAGTSGLVAARGSELFHSADGISWARYEDYAPNGFTAHAYAGMRFATPADSIEHLLLLANNGDRTQVWKKDIDYSTRSNYEFDWMLYPYNEEALPCPNLKDMQLTFYDNKVLLAGLADNGAIAPLYMSADKGRTWRKGGNYNLPEATNATGLTIASDSRGFLYVVYTGSGRVWRGRMNRIGWGKAGGDN